MAVPSFTLALNDILKARVVCYNNEQVAYNVLGYKVTAVTGGSITGLECATGLDVVLAPAYLDLMSQFAIYYGVGVSRVAPTVTAEQGTHVSTAGGNLVENLLPRQVAGVFTKLAPVPGPAGRGRVYVPFPGTGQSTANGHPTAGYMVLLGVLAGVCVTPQLIAGGAGTATVSPALLHRASYPASLLWTAATARNKWATQKRRGDYGRANTLPSW